MDKDLEKFIIMGLVMVLILLMLAGCVKPTVENKGPRTPTTLETVGKMKGIVSVLGCMFAPASEECQKLQSDRSADKEDQEWNDLDSEVKN
tara:strand:- start:293 stop:565 length:273 start_codon:yes stop_codon:yes gene_type:complete